MKPLPLVLALFILASPAFAQGNVPFVGCPMDGQLGPVPAPTVARSTPQLPEPAAGQLAYYASYFIGVLAPRGGSCQGFNGSNGAFLIVTPEPLLDSDKGAITGPVVYVSSRAGGTSGRFEVAAIATHIFPIAQDYVREMIARERVADEGFAKDLEASYAANPFTDDILVRQSETVVSFTTPANRDGLGTFETRLKKNADPIQGIAIILPDPHMELEMVRIRLPEPQRPLAGPIIADMQENHAIGGDGTWKWDPDADAASQ